MQDDLETYLNQFNTPPSVYVHFDRRRRRWSVTLYRRVLQKNYRMMRIFHNPDHIYEYVDMLCEKGCILKTELPQNPDSLQMVDEDRDTKL